MAKFDNIRIVNKILAVPLISCLIMAGILVNFLSAYRAIRTANEEAEIAEAVVVRVNHIISEYKRGHAALFEAINWKMVGLDQLDIDEARSRALAAATGALAGLTALKADGQAVRSEDWKTADSALQAYAFAAKAVAAAIDVDAQTPAGLMTQMSQTVDWSESSTQALLRHASQYADSKRSGAREALASTALRMIIGTAGAVIVAIVLSVLVARQISTPLVSLTAKMAQLADGQMDIEIPEVSRGDEVGSMGRALAVFRDSAAEAAKLTQASAAEQLARERRMIAMEAAVERLESLTAEIVNNLQESASGLETIAEQLTAAMGDVNSDLSSVSDFADAANSNVGTVAGAASNLSRSIDDVVGHIEASKNAARQAVNDADAAATSMADLVASAQEIGSVLELIAKIAAQTNLLALNATIEASRAGDAGKGFAVVASEVKGLAQQTSVATDQIRRKVDQIRAATRQASAAIDHFGETVSKVDRIAFSIDEAMTVQREATREIAGNADGAAQGTSAVAARFRTISTHTRQTWTVSGQVQDQAKGLSGQATRLRQSIGEFLEDIRSL